MKKLLFFLLFSLAFLGLVGCGGDDEVKTPSINVKDMPTSLEVGESREFSVEIVDGEDDLELDIKISVEDILIVEGNTVTALKEGSADITISLKDFKNVSKKFTITVTDSSPSLSLTGPNELIAGENITLVAKDRNTTDNVVYWESTNQAILTVDQSGVVTGKSSGVASVVITSLVSGETLSHEITVTAPEPTSVEVGNLNYDVVTLSTTFTLKATVLPLAANQTVEWSTSDEDIATVDERGFVKPLSGGEVTITATIPGTDIKGFITFTVEPTAMEIFALAHYENPVVKYDVMYWGNDNPALNNKYTVIGSVSSFFFGDVVVDDKTYVLARGSANFPGVKMKSLEYITIHDTASAGGGAKANAGWLINPANTGSSWHLTIGNDGVYKSMNYDEVAWHAGDGSREFNLTDTGVKATNKYPTVEIVKRDNKGYWKINGQDTMVEAPLGPNGEIVRIVDIGIYTEVGPNGNYFIGNAWYNSGFGGWIANTGGNRNSIGIETAMNNGSDLFLTWHYTAKVVADILVEHGLGIERVRNHHAFSGKDCPRTMRNAHLWEDFYKMVKVERLVREYLNDHEIEFISNNPEFVSNEGRVIKLPDVETQVSYVVRVTDPNGKVEQRIFYSTLQAKK